MQYPNIAQPQYGFAPTMSDMRTMPPTSNMPLVGYAGGGQVQAENVRSKGRNGDSMLVHMTPNEVAGLQALAMQHGGSLTTNPKTGLPEANFLESILPTLLGAGLMLIPGVNALGAAGIVTAAQTARTGDLGQGLLAGLGAYGGANIASGLQAAGANAASAAPTIATDTAVRDATVQANLLEKGLDTTAQAANITPTPMANVSTAAPATTAPVTAIPTDPGVPTQTMSASGQLQPLVQTPSPVLDPALDGTQGVAGGQGVSRGLPAQPPSLFDQSYQKLQQMGRGVSNIFDFGDAGTKARAAYGTKAGLGSIYAAAAPTLLATPKVEEPKEEKSNYTGPYTPSERQVRFPGEDERRRTSEYMYFTPSNPVPFERGGSVPQLENGGFVLTKKAVDGLGGGSNKKGQRVASRGLGAIPIRGKGTGTSDSIPTTIDGKHPARISNGEAYVPKDKVRRGGGAKKFYALMKKAERSAR